MTMPLEAGVIQQRLGSAAAKEQLFTVDADMPSTGGPSAIETEWASNASNSPTSCSARWVGMLGNLRAAECWEILVPVNALAVPCIKDV